jgi:hypothetical protein
VQVAVHVRPLIGSEQEAGCQESLAVTPGVPQVSRSLTSSCMRTCVVWHSQTARILQGACTQR